MSIAFTKPCSSDLFLLSLFPLWTESSHLYFHTGIYLIFSFSHFSFTAGTIFLPWQIFLLCLFHEVSQTPVLLEHRSMYPCLSAFQEFFSKYSRLLTREAVGRKKRRKRTQGQVFTVNNYCHFYQRVAWLFLPFATRWLISSKGKKYYEIEKQKISC